MRTKTLGSTLALGLAAVALVPSASAAGPGDVELGETFPADGGAPASCGPSLALQVGSKDASYAVPSSGVVTSVRMQSDDADTLAGFRLVRAAAPGYEVVGRADLVTIPGGSAVTQSVRLPALAGDVLGVYFPQAGGPCTRASGDGQDVVNLFLGVEPAVGENTGPAFFPVAGLRLSVAATLEPDVDGDGFGDTTQDRCPSQPATQGLCRFELDDLGAPTGTARVGRRLTAPRLVDPPSGTKRAFQWARYSGTRKAFVPIAGARSASYVLRKADRRTRVLVRVRLSKPGFATETMTSKSRRVR